MVVVSGLSHQQADASGDGNGDHTRGTRSWLTGVHPKRTEGADVRRRRSRPIRSPRQSSARTRALPSLELALDLNSTPGDCENSYSCVYMNTLAWRTPTTPLPTENNPRVVFERLFGDGGTDGAAAARALRENRSILDSVHRGDRRGCSSSSGRADRAQVDRVPRRGARSRAAHPEGRERQGADVELPDLERPTGIPERFDEHVKLMFDLQWLAFQADMTRVITFMLGARAELPHLSRDRHHRSASRSVASPRRSGADREDREDQHATSAAVRVFPREAAGDTPDGDGTLLDHSLFLYGGGHEQSATCTRITICRCSLAGGAGGSCKAAAPGLSGRHADDEPAADDARQGRRAGRVARRQHRSSGSRRAADQPVTARETTVSAMQILRSAAIAAGITGERWGGRPAGARRRRESRRPDRGPRRSPGPSKRQRSRTATGPRPCTGRSCRIAASWSSCCCTLARIPTRRTATASRRCRWPATNGNAAIVDSLLKAGADPNAALVAGETPLMTAARTGKAGAVQLLLARGATVDAREPVRGRRR